MKKGSGLNKTVSLSVTQGYSARHPYIWPLHSWPRPRVHYRQQDGGRDSDKGQRANPSVG